MFRANKKHKQDSLLDSSQWMNPKIQEKLKRSWAPIFYEHVFCKIDEEPFAVLYGTTGKPNFPVNILLSLEYIKHMKDCSDLELLDDFYFGVYQYCLDNPGKEDILFGPFISLLHSFAHIASISLVEQRTDTTLFMSNIKKAGRISLAYDVLAKAVKAVPKEDMTAPLLEVLEPNFKTDVLYRAKAQEGETKLTLLLSLCQEALKILETRLNSDEVRILKRFLAEQSTMDPESGKPVPKPNKEISSSSLQSAYDEDATYRRKGNVSQSGYVLEISETCSKDNDFQLITDYAIEPNNASDVEILQDRIESIRDTGCTDLYVDGGFHSPDVHQAAKENSIEIHLTNMSGTEPTKKLPVSEFDIDETTHVIHKCPAGHSPTHAGVNSGQTSAHFPHDACADCELKSQCYSKAQVKDCVVRINLKAVNACREREKMKAGKKENTSKRAGIEGSNSALKRKGLAKLDVRGKAKSLVVCGLKVTAQNIKRFIKYLQGGYKPKPVNHPQKGIPLPLCS